MKGDFSRLTFDPRKQYRGVVHQQGRVWLDSDWNEDVFNRLHLLDLETADLIGPCGVPEPGTAFRISVNPDTSAAPDDFIIEGGPGRHGHCYVRGILSELPRNTSYLSQPDLPDAPRIDLSTGNVTALVYLEVWQRLITALEDESLREVALGGPDTAARIKTVAQVKVVALPAKLVDPTCPEASAFLPGPGGGTLTTLQPKDTQPPDLCKLPDPGSYTGRENHLYRVEVHEGGNVGGIAGASFTAKLNQDHQAGAVPRLLAAALPPISLDSPTLPRAVSSLRRTPRPAPPVAHLQHAP